MRKLVSTLGLVTLAIVGLQVPSAIAGGNSLEFRHVDNDLPQIGSSWGDIFAVGESVVARADYLGAAVGSADGSFHLWIERGDALEAGSAIPESAIRVGTFEITADGTAAHAVFDIPAIPSGLYSFAVCDEPCTTTGFGFGTYVQGLLNVVQTPAEGQLLGRVHELRWFLRARIHDVRTDLRRAEERENRLETRLDAGLGALEESRAQVGRLTRAASRTPDRDVIDGTAGALIAVGLIAIAAVLLQTHRRDRIVVPDSPAGILTEDLRSVER